MKKLIALFVLAIVFASFSFGQSSYENRQTANTTKQIAKMNRLANPDLIFPNRELVLPIPGLNYPYIYNVIPGDCLWYISKRINRGEFTHDEEGKVVSVIEKPVIPDGESLWSKLGDFIALNLIWLLILIFVLAVIYKIVKWELSKPKNVVPTTAGAPQVGVNDRNAHSRINELASTRFPSATLVIKNIRRGHISGAGEIFYAGSAKPKRINLENVPAYAGEILVNGKKQTIYFLQGCGNDARQGNFMSGAKFIFTPDVIINSDGSERPLSQEQVDESEASQIAPKEEIKQEDPKPVKISTEPEIYKTISAHTMLADEFLKTQTAHRVTLKVTTSQGTVETVLETKTETKQTKTEEKKG